MYGNTFRFIRQPGAAIRGLMGVIILEALSGGVAHELSHYKQGGRIRSRSASHTSARRGGHAQGYRERPRWGRKLNGVI